jgi:hypothetical protein
MNYVLVALGSAFGGVARYWCSGCEQAWNKDPVFGVIGIPKPSKFSPSRESNFRGFDRLDFYELPL